jgi:hypothetical protein
MDPMTWPQWFAFWLFIFCILIGISLLTGGYKDHFEADATFKFAVLFVCVSYCGLYAVYQAHPIATVDVKGAQKAIQDAIKWRKQVSAVHCKAHATSLEEYRRCDAELQATFDEENGDCNNPFLTMKQYRGCRGNDVADAAEDLARRGGGVIRVDEGPLPSPPLPTEECLKCAPGQVIVTGGKWCIGPEVPPPDPLPEPEPSPQWDVEKCIKDCEEQGERACRLLCQGGPLSRIKRPEPEPLPAPPLKEVHDTLERIRQNGPIDVRLETNGKVTVSSRSDPSLAVTTDDRIVSELHEPPNVAGSSPEPTHRPNIVEYRYKVIETWDEMAKRFGEQVCITETIDWAESVLFCRDRCDKEESTNRFHFSTCWERCLNIIL